MNTKLSGIYRITLRRPVGAESHYVGQSGHLKRRLGSHRSQLRHGTHSNRHLQSAWGKFGPDAFAFEIVELVADAAALTATEERWIENLGAKWERGGFNQRIVADSCLGLKKSPEAVARSAAGNRGKSRSADHKAAISAANKGRKPTAECIAAALKAREGLPPGRLGKPLTKESRAKVRKTKIAAFRKQFEGQDLASAVSSPGNPKNPNAQKTQCKRGHAFTLENTRISKKGTRECRACARDYQVARRFGLVARNTVTPEMLGAA